MIQYSKVTKIMPINFIFFFSLFMFYIGIGQNIKKFTFSEPAMGTTIRVVFYTSDSLRASQVSKAVFERVNTLNAIFSDYDYNSELMQLCAAYKKNKPIKVSDELFNILQYSKKIYQETNGQFDVTVGPYTKMWRKTKKNMILPSEQRLSFAKKIVGYQNIFLNTRNKTLKFNRLKMQIDLGGIAKGYTADEVIKVLNSYDISQVLIDFGGDITLGNPPPNKKGWNVNVSYTNHLGKHISEIVSISNMSIATSGDYYQKLSIDGVTYSHIIDPTTGLGITKSIQVTVIASSGYLADSYASAFSIMCKKDIEKLLSKNKNIHVFLTTLESTTTQIWYSELFRSFLIQN